MIEPATIPTGPPEHPILDYAALVAEGRRHLERMTDERWTDFNAHDPGITILEAFCYALTDLGYRIFHDIPDLLAQPADAERAGSVLFSAAEILTGRAVTTDDLRRLVLDVPGVRNAWIEPALGPPAVVSLRYEAGPNHIILDYGAVAGEASSSEPLILTGLHRVLVESSGRDPGSSASLERAVATRLHANRNLCEDFAEIVILGSFAVRLRADIEIAEQADGQAVLLAICDALADYLSPTIPFTRLAEALAGRPVESLFEGPAPSRGFVDPAKLAAAERRRALHLSDMIREIMAVPGVRAVRTIAFVDAPGEWTLPVPELEAPQLDIAGSTFRLFNDKTDGVRLDVTAAFARRGAAVPNYLVLPRAERDLLPPGGRYREVGRYRPLQADLPAAFGVGAGTLPASTPPERRSASTQLRAYLALFDHLLASYFAELELLPQRFSPERDGPVRTYVAGSVPEIRPVTDAPSIYAPDLDAAALQALIEPDGAPEALRRRNRLLNHLLARFAEELGNDPLSERLVRTKELFLRELPTLSGGRGTGVNLLSAPGPAADTPLLRRLLLQLDLDLQPDERILVVEHILLRPQPGDAGQDPPLLAEAAARDPYSLQLTVALPERLRGGETRIARLVRAAIPAHLAAYLRWLNPAAMASAVAAYEAFLASRGSLLRDRYGLGDQA
jgi:hypothetical protein